MWNIFDTVQCPHYGNISFGFLKAFKLEKFNFYIYSRSCIRYVVELDFLCFPLCKSFIHIQAIKKLFKEFPRFSSNAKAF